MDKSMELLDLRISRIEIMIEAIYNTLPNKQSSKQHNIGDPVILTSDQAAEFLNLSKQTLYQGCSNKKIPYMKRAKRLYFDRQELINYLRDGKQA